jgi:U3 small nucleolar RNA-associated protein 12
MMKSYLRYEPSRTIGVVASPSCNIATSVDGNLCMTGGVQDAQVWNLRTGERIATLTAENPNYPYSNSGETRCLRVSHDGSTMAVGYTSGDIRIFDYIKGTTLTTLHGHRSEVLCLVYESSATSTFLLSGGADTDIYLWDTVSLTGVCCLRGHKGPVTGLGLLSRSGGQLFVVSCSKDTLLKVWDVATQTCIQTVVGHRSEVWSLAVVGDHVVTGSSDEFLRCYKVCDDSTVLLGDDESVLELVGQVAHSSSSSGSASSRQSKCVQLCVNSSRTLLAAVSDHKTVELFRLRGAAELEKKQKRLRKRQRERESRGKGATGQSEWEADDQEANAEGEEDGQGQGQGEGGESDSSFQDLVEHVGTVRASAKVKSFTFSPKQHVSASASSSVSNSIAGSGKGTVAGISERCILSTVDNCLATYGVSFLPGKAKSEVASKVSQIDLHGHRSDVRCVAASDDGLLIATGSAEGVKTWSTNTFACVSSATVGYCTSLAFVRGGRFLVLGTREGNVQVRLSLSFSFSLLSLGLPTLTVAPRASRMTGGAT